MIKTAYIINYIPFNNFLFSNSEASFIYDAINNKISGYPKTVPDFTHLPIDCIIDAVGTSERIHIEYTDDDDYENGIITAQDPAAGAAWSDGVIVSLTVNRKYSGINSRRGYMCESLGKLYLLTRDYDSDYNYTGTIWTDGEKLVEGDITKIYADNGNIYFNASGGVYKLNAEGVSQVLGKEAIQQVVNNEKIYYRNTENEEGFFHCYNMNDKTDSLVTDEPVIFLYANTDYIICHSMHDIFILDGKSYKIIKHISSEKFFTECSLDNDNVYYAETSFEYMPVENYIITKYNIKQDEQIAVLDSNEPVGYVLAVDDKIIIEFVYRNEAGFRYIDMRTMEGKYLTMDDVSGMDYNIEDILFDGQQIIYAKEDRTVYSISIFTGETKKIDLISSC